MHVSEHEAKASGAGKTAVERLVASHREFLRFLERRVGSREEAEEILQAAFVKTFERADTLREDDNVVAWFYRLLRNALIDRARRAGAESRALAKVAGRGGEEAEAFDEELHQVVCHCVMELVDNLDPKYADILKEVDVGERAIGEVADAEGITANNARVRLHRARQALKKQLEACCGTCADHGCAECSCGG